MKAKHLLIVIVLAIGSPSFAAPRCEGLFGLTQAIQKVSSTEFLDVMTDTVIEPLVIAKPVRFRKLHTRSPILTAHRRTGDVAAGFVMTEAKAIEWGSSKGARTQLTVSPEDYDLQLKYLSLDRTTSNDAVRFTYVKGSRQSKRGVFFLLYRARVQIGEHKVDSVAAATLEYDTRYGWRLSRVEIRSQDIPTSERD